MKQGKRYIIINADDYGICPETNEAIEELFNEKKISSSTLLVTAPFAADALEAAIKYKYPIGAHFTLHSDWEGENRWHCAAPPDSVASLNEDGFLSASASKMAADAKSAEVSRELEAQIKQMIQCGCPPTHADSHGGTLYGFGGRLFFINALRLCKKYDLPFRLPKGKKFLSRQFPQGVPIAVKIFQGAACVCAAVLGVPLIDDMISNPQKAEEIGSYEALCRYYLDEVAAIGPGVTEVFLHPSLPSSACGALTSQWQKRVWEYKFLKSGMLEELLNQENIELIGWEALQHGMKALALD